MINNHLKDRNFVATAAVKECLGELIKHQVMIITGEQGCGKTKIGLEILSKCHQLNENCDVIILSNLTEIRKAIATENSENGIVLLMDDVFGKTKCTYDEDKHELSLDILNAYVNGGNLTVIFIMRTQIFQCIQHLINSHSLFQDHFHVNLNSENYKLKTTERMTILFDYCKRNKIEFCKESSKERFEDEGILNKSTTVFLHLSKLTKIIDSDPEIGFLKACVLFTTRRQFTRLGLQLFMYPTMDMISKIDSLRALGRTNINDRLSFVILVYILLNDNCLARNNVNLEKIRAIDHSCYGTGSLIHTIISIWDTLDDLNGVYLTYNAESTNYVYKHKNIVQCVLLSFGKIATEEVIPLIDISFIENIVKLENYIAKEEEVCLIVSQRLYRCLTHRLKQLLKDKCTQPFRFVESLVGFKFMKQNDLLFQRMLLDDIGDSSAKDMLEIECEGKVEKVVFYFPAVLLYYSVQQKSSFEQIKKCLDYIRSTYRDITEVFSYTCCILVLKSFEILCINDKETVILSVLWDSIDDLNIGCNIMHYIHICLDRKRISVSRWILHQLSCKINIAKHFSCMLCNALRPRLSPVNKQMIGSITWVVENISDPDAQEMIQIICNTDFEDIFFFLLQTFSKRQLDYSKIILPACQKGWYHVVRWLIDKTKEIEDLNTTCSLIQAACKFHWDDILDIFENNRKLNFAIEKECLLATFEVTISLLDYCNVDNCPEIKTVVKEELLKQDCFPTFVGWVFQHFPKHLSCKDNSQENFVRTLEMLESNFGGSINLRYALREAVKYIARKADLRLFASSYISNEYFESRSCDVTQKCVCEIVKFIMHNTRMDQFDLHNACNEAFKSENFKMVSIIWQNIDHKNYNIGKLISSIINKLYNVISDLLYTVELEAEIIFLLCNTNSHNINWMHMIRSTLKISAFKIFKWIVQNTQFDHFQIEAIVKMSFNHHKMNFLFQIENNERTNLKRLIKTQSMKNVYRLLSSYPQNDIFELLKNVKDEMEISDKKTFLRNAVKFTSSEIVEYISILEVPIDILNTQHFIQSSWMYGCYDFINHLLNKNVELVNILNVAEKYKCHCLSDGMVDVMICLLKRCDCSLANLRSIAENLLHNHANIAAKKISIFLQLLLEKTPNLASMSTSFVVNLILIYTDCFATVKKMLEITDEEIDKTLFMQSLFKSASRQIDISIETYMDMLRYVLNSSKNSVEIDIMSILDSALKETNFLRGEPFELVKCLLQNVDNALIDSKLLILSFIRSVINSSIDLTIYINFLEFLLFHFNCSTTDITNGVKLIFSEQLFLGENCVRCVMFLLKKSNYNSHDIEEIISLIMILVKTNSFLDIFLTCDLLKNMLDNPNLNLKDIDCLPFISKCFTRYGVIRRNHSNSIVDVIKLLLINVELNVKDVTKMLFENSMYIFYDNELTLELMELILKDFSLTEINTMMTEACHYGDMGIVRVLLRKQKKQLDINAAFSVACVSGHVHVAEFLWDNVEKNEFDQKSAVDRFLNSELRNSGMLLWILQHLESKNIDMQKAMKFACLRIDYESVKCLWDKENRTLFNMEIQNIAEEEENVSQILVIAFANHDLSIIDDLSQKIDLQAFAIKEDLLTKLIELPYESDLIVWLVRNIPLRLLQIRIVFKYAILYRDIQCVRAVADKSLKKKIDLTCSFDGVALVESDIKWVLDNCRFAFSRIDMKTLMNFACKTSLQIVKCILENIDQTQFDMTKCLIMTSYIYNKNEDIFDWLIQNVDHDKFNFTIAVSKIHDPEFLERILNDVDLTCIDIESLLITTYKFGRFNKLSWLLQETPISCSTFKVPICSLMQIDGGNVTSFDNAEEDNVGTDSDYEYDCCIFSDSDSEFDEEDDIDMFFWENYNNNIERNDSCERSEYSQNESNIKEEIAFLHLLKNIKFENSDLNTITKEMSRRGWLKPLKWMHSKYTLGSFNVEIVIYEACRNGRKNIVKWLVLQNFNLDLREVMKESCGYGWIDIVNWLWETADQQIFDMTNSLQEACEYGRLNIVRWVTDNVPKENLNAQTLMNAACKNSWKDIILWVFNNFSCTFYDISRAVKEACAFDALEVVELIHKHHPFDQTMATEAMHASLQNKSEHGKGEVAMFLFQGFNADIFNTEIILTYACEYGWIALVKQIFEKGIDNTIDISKSFHLACMNGETQIVEIIICNADPRKLDPDSAMAEICSHGWDEILNLFLIRKNIPHELFDMEKAFNTACEFGQLEIVEILSENLDVKLLNLKTAMNKACRSRMNERLVRFLLDKFDNEKFDMDKVSFAVQEYEWQDITKTYTDFVQIW
ncbi:unnamed protein product [Mytilus coruscus]|uniref:Novel STAND NTPase 3 domain-containing protein n=1 Tax=Mytilus coruscus TaxID=42192 RepID=A0A6J8CTE7_MYTCO|nr:unnamed protein product [Mytilus coruscus]